MRPINKDCSNTFLERSFIYAAPCEWKKMSEHIRTSNLDCFRKSVKTMLFTQQYGCCLKSTMFFMVYIIVISVLFTVNYCNVYFVIYSTELVLLCTLILDFK